MPAWPDLLVAPHAWYLRLIFVDDVLLVLHAEIDFLGHVRDAWKTCWLDLEPN
jgi:hypothetical protein